MVVAFSSRVRIWGECSTNRSPPALLFFLFFKWRLACASLYARNSPHWLSRLRRLWPSVQLRVNSFPDKVPTQCLDNGIVSPLRLRWVKSVCVFRCNLPPALLAEWPGSFSCHCGNMWVKRTPNKNQHTKLTLEKKILLPRFELAIFQSRVRRTNQQAIKPPIKHFRPKHFCNWSQMWHNKFTRTEHPNNRI